MPNAAAFARGNVGRCQPAQPLGPQLPLATPLLQTKLNVPVNYMRIGDELLVTSYRSRTWWRNLRGSVPVTVRVQGQDLRGIAQAISDDDGVAAGLIAYLQSAPSYAKYFDVGLDANGQPDSEDVALAARARVIVRVRLTSAPEKVSKNAAWV